MDCFHLGGNDLGFGPIIKACVRNRDCSKAKNAEVTEGLDDLRSELPNVYSKIQSKAPNATVLILDYPTLFPDPDSVALRNCHDLRLFRSGTLLKISVHEVKWLRRIGKELNSVIRKSAREADVAFVEVASSLAGHEVCTSEPWVRGLTERHLEFSFHPLAEGHDAIAEEIRDEVIGVIPGF